VVAPGGYARPAGDDGQYRIVERQPEASFTGDTLAGEGVR
jgi:hypothetical protein